jgi:predicted DNA-binding transcriptional regulator AlpA
MTIQRLEQVPDAINILFDQIGEIKALLSIKPQDTPKEWMNVEELIEYLPSHPARQTVYAMVSRKDIPCTRINGRLIFIREEIDEWLKNKKKLSKEEINQQVAKFIENRKK